MRPRTTSSCGCSPRASPPASWTGREQGKAFASAVVDFPPTARATPHRHGRAFVYAYVLAGTVRSKLGGKPVTTYHQGENWVEQPGVHPVLTENTNRTKRAGLLVILVSHTGDKLKVDDPRS